MLKIQWLNKWKLTDQEFENYPYIHDAEEQGIMINNLNDEHDDCKPEVNNTILYEYSDIPTSPDFDVNKSKSRNMSIMVLVQPQPIIIIII